MPVRTAGRYTRACVAVLHLNSYIASTFLHIFNKYRYMRGYITSYVAKEISGVAIEFTARFSVVASSNSLSWGLCIIANDWL